MPYWYPSLDETDQLIFDRIKAAWENQTEIKVGDFIRFKNGELARVAYIWPDGIQPSADKYGSSFSVSVYKGLKDGIACDRAYMSFSGGLYNIIPFEKLKLTDEKIDGSCWFFHHDLLGAHRGVYTNISCQVWECDKESNGHAR